MLHFGQTQVFIWAQNISYKNISIYNILQALVSPKHEGKCGTRGIELTEPKPPISDTAVWCVFLSVNLGFALWTVLPSALFTFSWSFVVSQFSSLWLGISWVSLEENQSIFKNVKEIFSDIQASKIIGSSHYWQNNIWPFFC